MENFFVYFNSKKHSSEFLVEQNLTSNERRAKNFTSEKMDVIRHTYYLIQAAILQGTLQATKRTAKCTLQCPTQETSSGEGYQKFETRRKLNYSENSSNVLLILNVVINQVTFCWCQQKLKKNIKWCLTQHSNSEAFEGMQQLQSREIQLSIKNHCFDEK